MKRYLTFVVVMLTAACVPAVSPSPERPTSQAPASEEPAPTESASHIPTPLTSGALVQALVDGLRVRNEPGLDATPVARLSAGQRARVVDGPQDADGYRWYQVSLMPSDVSGWVAAGEGSTPWIAAVLNGMITLTAGRDIWTIDQDGNRERFAQLGEGLNAWEPSWSPDGAALAIAENRPNPSDPEAGILEGTVAVFDAGGTLIAQSSPPAGTYDTYPSWSPDGTHIAFTRGSLQGTEESGVGLYVMDTDGANEHLVVPAVSSPTGDTFATVRYSDSAVWSPTGDTFAYVRFDREASTVAGDVCCARIWTIGTDGSGEQLLGGLADDGSRERLRDWIAWSPDGSVLAYSRAVGNDLGTVELDLIDLAGHVSPILSYPGPVSETFSWVPDGSALAYYQQEIGGFTTSVVVLSSSGEEIARFDQPDGVPDRAIVSPDGSSLAWYIQGTSDLRIQPIAGGDARTFTVAPNAGVAWQPLLLR